MSILGRLMGKAETAAARGGRTAGRAAPRGRVGMGRTSTSRTGMRSRATTGRTTGRGMRGGRTAAPTGGLGRMVENFLRRR